MTAKSQEQYRNRANGINPTATPAGLNKWALDVRNMGTVSTVGTDTVDSFDANSNKITAASHAALPGDRIKFTSGDNATLEYTVYTVTTNTIELVEDPSFPIAALDAFSILRPTSEVISTTGAASAVAQFILDGSAQDVVEDTVTPANNIPLPVKILDTTGEVDLRAAVTALTNIDADTSSIISNTTPLNVVDFIDTTPVIVASSTNIPASASTPLTIVASLAAAVKKVAVYDTTGAYIGLYSDPAGTPVLEAVFGPGADNIIDVTLPATTVLGIRNMANTAITTGSFTLNFIG